MNTNRRGKKKNDVSDKVAAIWNQRLLELIETRYNSQKAFAQAYKEEYGTGNQADVSRWVNVGNESEKGKVIGLPSYDTMRRVADFFGVTVGYLTGETDYTNFDMERACNYFGIDGTTGTAIRRITKLEGATRFEKFEKENYGRILCHLLTVDSFEDFLGSIGKCAEAIYRQKHPVDPMNSPKVRNIPSDILDVAIKYHDICYADEIEDPAEITDEVVAAIHIINDAVDEAYNQQFALEENVKVVKYDLQEKYFQLIAEVLNPQILSRIQSHYYEPVSSIDELKQRIDRTIAPEQVE